MLTNPRNTFRGQSRSPNTVPYLVGVLTLSLRCAVFPIFDFKNVDLEIWVRDQKVVPFDIIGLFSY